MAAKRIPLGIDRQEGQVDVPHFQRALQVMQGDPCVVETGINQSLCVRRDLPFDGEAHRH
jgi:hypothetical protein